MLTCYRCAGTGLVAGTTCPKCFGRRSIYAEAAGLILSWDGISFTGVATLRVNAGKVTFATYTPLAATIVNGLTVPKTVAATIEPTTISATFYDACPLGNAHRGKRAAISYGVGGVSGSGTAVLASFDPLDIKANDVLRWAATFQLEG